MRATLAEIENWFDEYNKMCFGGILTRPPILLNSRLNAMGRTVNKWHKDVLVNKITESLHIEISIRLDLPEEEYRDTLLHEMIHYWIMSTGQTDDGIHGTLFMNKMNELINKYGVKITVNYKPSDDILIDRIEHPRHVCVLRLNDGKVGFAVVAKNKIAEIGKAFSEMPSIKSVDWYVSERGIFGSYPTQVYPEFIVVDGLTLKKYLKGATPLVDNHA